MNINAQITTQGISCSNAVQNLIGQGVTISNVTCDCNSSAMGSFNNANNLPVSSGVIMTTGNLGQVTNGGCAGGSTVSNGHPSNGLLNGIAGNSTFDQCTIEFDITPTCNTLQISFFFASEEYPEYVGSNFNDAFAFFISGPGISGTQNLAVVPSSSTPVTINTINPSTNSSYYNSNGSCGRGIEFDGYTDALTTYANVIQCQTYHMIITIADAGDANFDSGVFLLQNGLSCPGGDITVSKNVIDNCTAPSCNSSINLSISGGTPPYTTTWKKNNTFFSSSSNINNLCEGIYTVEVLDNACHSFYDTINIKDARTPNSSFTVSDVCLSTASPITNTSTIPSPDVITTYTWDFGDGTTSNQITPSHTYSSSGTYNIELTVESNKGCIATFSLPTEIFPTPSVLFSPSSSCIGSSTTFIDQSSVSNGTITSWSWDFDDGNTSTNQNPLHLFSSVGTYNVQLNVTTNNNCTGSTTIPFTVNPLPVSDAGQDSILNCSRTSMNLDGSGSDMGANFSHLWTTTDGNIVSGASTVSPLINQNGTYTITTTNVNTGCSSSDDVTINNDTIMPVSNAGSDTAITCIPQVNLDGSLSSQGNYSYLWTTNNGNIISGNTTLTPTVGAVATYYLEVTSLDNGCTDLDSVYVGIDTLKPIANAGIDTLITCGHMNIDLNGSLSDTGSLFSYNWGTVGGNIVSNGTTLYPNVDADGIYYITVLNSRNNCTATDSVNVGIDTIHPIAYAGVDSIVTCSIPVIALNGAGSSVGNFSYQWTTNDGNIIANDTTLTPSIDMGGVYTITVTNNYNGCSSSDNVNILADLTAVVDILYNSISVDSIFGVAPEEVDFSWVGDYGTITWDLGDNNSSTDSSLTHTYNLRGDYWAMITLVDSSGCIAYDSVYVLIDGREIVFPNIFTPNGDGENDIFTFRAERIKEFECAIYNRWGQLVFSWNAPVGGWDGRTYAGKESPSGEYLYILHAVDRNGKAIEKKGFVMLMR